MPQKLLDLVNAAFTPDNDERYAVIEDCGVGRSFMTYKELQETSKSVTENLSKICSNKHQLIAVCLEQNIIYPAVIIGILQFGSAFTCADPRWTSRKRETFFRQLGVSWYITCQSVHDTMERDATKSDCEPGNNMESHHRIHIRGQTLEIFEVLPVRSEPLDFSLVAYVVQTSGSTGSPKVVRVPHSSVVPNILDLRILCNISSDDVIFLSSPSTFDPSIVELFLALSSGAGLLVTSSGVKASPALLLQVLFPNKAGQGITVLQTTPSVLCRWSVKELQNVVLGEKSSLKTLILGGEPCPPVSVITQWKGSGNQTVVYNIYGISEVSVWASIYKVSLPAQDYKLDPACKTNNRLNTDCMVDQESVVELGSPLSETLLQLRDMNTGLPVEDGVGEMFIGSMSRMCIIDDESYSDLKPPVYRATGDVVRCEGGHSYFIGRRDRIVKRWGQRVSLEQIELIAGTHVNVARACCVWQEDSNSLDLFVVPAGTETGRLRDNLQQFLLIHVTGTASVPDNIILVDNFPLTSHGKIDRSALHLQVFPNRTAKQEAIGDIVDVFSELWCSLLGVQKPCQSFLISGGNSFLALRLSNTLAEKFGGVPEDLVTLLLSGVSFEHCCERLLTFQFEHIKSIRPVLSWPSETEMRKESLVETNLNTKSSTSQASGIAKSDLPGKRKYENLKTYPENVALKRKTHVNCMHDSLISVSVRGRHIVLIDDTSILSLPAIKGPKCQNDTSFKIKWTVDLGKCIDASPLCLLYKSGLVQVAVGSHSGQFVVANGKTGDLISSCVLPDRIESTACPSSCGQYVYVGCYDGTLYCIAVKSGTVRWKFATGGMIKCSPVLCNQKDSIIFGSYDKVLYCIHCESGHLLWKYSQKDGAAGSWLASPVVMDGVAVACSLAGLIVALELESGLMKWAVKVPSPIFSSPAEIQLLCPFVLCTEVCGLLHCFQAMTGDKVWEWKAGGEIFSSPTAVPEVEDNGVQIVFGCQDSFAYCLHVDYHNHVSLRWKISLNSPVVSIPFAVKNTSEPVADLCTGANIQHKGNDLSVLVKKQSITIECVCILASTSGEIIVVDVNGGNVMGTYHCPSEIFSSPVMHDGNIYVGCRNNLLYCLSLIN